jgi:hypothetical protein
MRLPRLITGVASFPFYCSTDTQVSVSWSGLSDKHAGLSTGAVVGGIAVEEAFMCF